MSFSLEFHARSREHAKRLLDLHSSQLPSSVLNFIKASIDGVQPLRDGFSRVFHVKAIGPSLQQRRLLCRQHCEHRRYADRHSGLTFV